MNALVKPNNVTAVRSVISFSTPEPKPELVRAAKSSLERLAKRYGKQITEITVNETKTKGLSQRFYTAWLA